MSVKMTFRNNPKIINQSVLLQSRSLPKFSISKRDHNSQERTLIQGDGSYCAERITNHISYNYVKKPSQIRTQLDKISDFYDKKQINDAIFSIGSLKDRVKFVESIVKRRSEIREIEEQTKLEKMAPIISKVTEVLKNKVLNKTKQSQVRRSFYIENLQALHNTNSLASSIIHSGTVSRTSPRNITQEMGHLLLDTSPKVTFSPNSRNTEGMDDTSRFKETPTNGTPVMNQRRKTKEILALMTKHLQTTDDSPRGLVFPEEEKVEKHETVKEKTEESLKSVQVKRKAKSLGSKCDTPRSKVGSLTRTDYQLGAKVLEKDIYRYLVKNQKREEAKKVITNTEEPREPLMRQIEVKAKTKFINFLDRNKHANYMVPPSLKTTTNLDEKLKDTSISCRHILNEIIGKDHYVPNRKKLNKTSNKSWSFVRVLKPSLPNSPQATINQSKEQIDPQHHESFASLTETKLDNIYRDSHNINHTLSLLNSQINEASDKEQLKKLEDYKKKKLEVLHQNSREVIRAIDHKIGRREYYS